MAVTVVQHWKWKNTKDFRSAGKVAVCSLKHMYCLVPNLFVPENECRDSYIRHR